jgi:hypothetical protein
VSGALVGAVSKSVIELFAEASRTLTLRKSRDEGHTAEPCGCDVMTMASALTRYRSGGWLDISVQAYRITEIAGQDLDTCRGSLTHDPHEEGPTMLTWSRARAGTAARV